jgi:hypothetical protein
MTELRAAMIKAHRANLERYCRLLATELTETERTFIHCRITDEQLALEKLYKVRGFSGEAEEARKLSELG